MHGYIRIYSYFNLRCRIKASSLQDKIEGEYGILMNNYQQNWQCLVHTIGHFRVHLSLHFKARLGAKSLSWKSVFILIEIGTKGRVAIEPILFTSNFWRGKNWQKFRKGQILVVVALDQHVWAKTSLIDRYVMSRYLQSRKHLAHWLCKNGSSYTDDYFRSFRTFVEFCVSVLTEQRSIFSIVDALSAGFSTVSVCY